MKEDKFKRYYFEYCEFIFQMQEFQVNDDNLNSSIWFEYMIYSRLLHTIYLCLYHVFYILYPIHFKVML